MNIPKEPYINGTTNYHDNFTLVKSLENSNLCITKFTVMVIFFFGKAVAFSSLKSTTKIAERKNLAKHLCYRVLSC